MIQDVLGNPIKKDDIVLWGAYTGPAHRFGMGPCRVLDMFGNKVRITAVVQRGHYHEMDVLPEDLVVVTRLLHGA